MFRGPHWAPEREPSAHSRPVPAFHSLFDCPAEDETTCGSTSVQEENDDDRCIEEILIASVADRRPLWDHKMPLTERSKTVRDKLWVEIKAELNNDWTLELIQKKWKSLRDRYFRIHNEEEYVPSGNGAKANKPTWKYFHLLKFLSDNNIPRPTISTSEENNTGVMTQENTF
ncbi:unnamed protein product [Phaedon cochleariae]|uniref:MADF domain-containing protein n=1 Tax=Phaedon cochleariae TaxID=80249 RepID=A0A9N9X5V1_PHACE|nr:unnamed protein product [Phaedon cochleariae]